MHQRLDLRQRPRRHIPEVDGRRIAVIVQELGQRQLLYAADRHAVLQHRQLRDAGCLQQGDGVRRRRVRADRYRRTPLMGRGS